MNELNNKKLTKEQFQKLEELLKKIDAQNKTFKLTRDLININKNCSDSNNNNNNNNNNKTMIIK